VEEKQKKHFSEIYYF